MNPVTVVGMIAGLFLIGVVVVIAYRKHEVSAGSVALAVIGLVLIGMSQWTSIRIKGGGVDIDLSALERQVHATAAAVQTLAEETVATAAVAESTRDQLQTLAVDLRRSNVVSAAFANTLTDSLAARPDVDTAAIRARWRQLGGMPQFPVADTMPQ